jgi:hypothetical protein
MITDYHQLIPAGFHLQSRVWIYQSSRIFSGAETDAINTVLNNFTTHWQSHGAPVKGFATVLFNQFVLIMADETDTGVSGCSTDSSVRVVRSLEQDFSTTLFDRQLLAFLINDTITLVPLARLSSTIQEGSLQPGTLYFNNLVATKAELLNQWIIPAGESWLAGRFQVTA